MTKLEILQNEAREKYKTFPVEGDHMEMTDGVFIHDIEDLMEFITHIYTQAVNDCREALPKERTMDAALKAGSDAGAGDTIGHNYCVREADENLAALLPKI